MSYEEPLTRRPIRPQVEHPELKEMECDNENVYDYLHDNDLNEDDFYNDIGDEKPLQLKKRNNTTPKKLYPDIPIEGGYPPQCKATVYQPKTIFNSSCSKNVTNKETKPTSHANGEPKININYGILSIVIFLFVSMIVFFYLSPIKGLLSYEKQEVSDATKIVKTLKNDFAHQPELSLRIVKESLKKVINISVPEPSKPAILLLLSSKHARDVGICFALQLARLISMPEDNFLEINGESLMNTEPSIAKEEIDTNITKAFEIDGQTVVLFKHLDRVPSPTAMMLHSYCDHENAPFKKVVFILTISTEENILKNADSKDFDSFANSRLMSVWADLHDDQLYALLSRITVSVAAILPDDLPSYCSFLQ